MSKQYFRIAAVGAALAMTAGCAKKTPEQLPPPPATTPVAEPTEPAPVTETIVPGSRADFMRSVASDRVFFETDSHLLDDRAQAVLNSQAAWLAGNPNVRVTIEGHCDERGTREYNLALGERRANAAKNHLVSRGVDASRITTISWGKERPETLGSNEEAWAQNRRAVTIVPQ